MSVDVPPLRDTLLTATFRDDIYSTPTTQHTSNGNRMVSADDDVRNDNVAQGMRLLLAARERVLSLSERRVSQILLHHDTLL